MLHCPGHTWCTPAVLASWGIEFPFSQSQKNSILDDKLNGHATKCPWKSVNGGNFQASWSWFMTKAKERADTNSETQAEQDGQCRSCPLGPLAQSCDRPQRGRAEHRCQNCSGHLGGCHLHVSTWWAERHYSSASLSSSKVLNRRLL